MIINLSYDELQQYVASSAGQDLNMKYVDAQTCEVCIGVKIPIVNKILPVSVTIRVDEVRNNDLFLSCIGNSTFDMAIDMALPMLQNKIGVGVIEKGADNQIVIHLDKNEKFAGFLKKVQPTAVNFSEEMIHIHGVLL